jgi:hypothetical protein
MDLVFKRLEEHAEAPRYRWDALLNPPPVQTYAVAAAAEQKARTITPEPVKKSTTTRRKKA